jgi:hypothetical protein
MFQKRTKFILNYQIEIIYVLFSEEKTGFNKTNHFKMFL